MGVSEENRRNAEIARKLYIESADSIGEAKDWSVATATIRENVIAALAASKDLRDFPAALSEDAAHMLVFRHLLAPPKSQDQFKLLCGVWSKGSEKSGRPQGREAVDAISSTLRKWMDVDIAPWLGSGRDPTAEERNLLVERVVSFIAPKLTDTQRRTRLSAEQERSVVDLLKGLGWKQLPSATIDTRAAVPPKHFMNKTRFATATTTAQEVDIACGFNGSYVAAVECKVTNDATNSVKRINDVLKKSAAWKSHWGSFVEPAALLQGVINPEDVQRLTDEGVRVFWSHDLGSFAEWVQARI